MKRIAWTWLSWLVMTGSFAQTARMDDAIDERVFFLKDLEFFIDSTNTISFDQVSDSSFATRFKKHPLYQNKDYRSGASYWIRFSVEKNQYTAKNWLIEFYDQTIDRIDAYLPGVDGKYEHRIMGDHFTFAQRSIAHKNFEIPVRSEGAAIDVYYFRVQSHEFADIRIAFRSVSWFINYAISEYFLYGTFYGMILIIALYNFLVYLAIREIKYVYYIFYILSVALYALSIDGIGFQYLWPGNPGWNDYAGGVFLYLLILWALVFTRRFLSTRVKAPVIDKILVGMIGVRTMVFLFELFFYPEFFAIRFIEIVPLALILFAGIKIWMRGYRPARFFVLAYGLLMAGFFFRSMVYFDLIRLTTVSHYSLHFSFVIEMLLLTVALGDRITILKENRDRALRRIIHQHEVNMELKDKVNRELEAKVADRTSELNKKNLELEESNARLLKQTREINQINSVLDLDNWKLKNRVKEVLEEMLMEKTMDYHEFNTLYPDTLACYRFLEQLKWGNGYHCARCRNDRYFEGSQKFARRCTRCGYNESITAHTIFQGVKFPIEKAFFITYLVVSGKKTYTLESLAETLDLRVATVWAFKQKVLQQIGYLHDSGKIPVASKWQEVILLRNVLTKAR
jgi:hypothetical protein